MAGPAPGTICLYSRDWATVRSAHGPAGPRRSRRQDREARPSSGIGQRRIPPRWWTPRVGCEPHTSYGAIPVVPMSAVPVVSVVVPMSLCGTLSETGQHLLSAAKLMMQTHHSLLGLVATSLPNLSTTPLPSVRRPGSRRGGPRTATTGGIDGESWPGSRSMPIVGSTRSRST